MTDFSEKVFELLKTIPKGKVTTYAEMAKMVESSPRAIGQALKRNPRPVEVPCHRVVMSDGSLGGYCGNAQAKAMEKASLLESEGVEIRAGRIDLERFMHKLIS